MPTLPWTRFWRPIDQQVHLDDEGLLVDPLEGYGKALNENVRTLESLDGVQCLVLLGEPGSGKSIALQQEKTRLAASGRDQINVVELKDYGDETELFRAVSGPAGCAVRKDVENLILLIDSLDEGLLRISHLTRVILRALGTIPRDHLRLRIACRLADWPATFQAHLAELFGKDKVEVRVLLPLRGTDVREGARAAGVAPDAFLSQVTNRRVGPFAARPVTLQFLLRAYRQNGDLPESREDLYERGCLDLCREPDRERREQQLRQPSVDHLRPESCLAVASRIAAVMLFGNRAGVVVGDENEGVRQEDVVVSGLAGGEESGDPPVRVDSDVIRAALRTGLFVGGAHGRLGFAHRSYAEFLAARYARTAPIEQIKGLLSESGGIAPGLIPQLSEVAAWVAGAREDVFSWMVSTDPALLLRTDTAKLQPKLVASVVSALLAKIEADDLPETWELREAYPRLTHPGLADQLRPFLLGKDKKIGPRRAAIYMAEACRIVLLQGLLADVALDPTEPLAVRIQAAHALCRIGDQDAKRRLLPLARGEAGADPEDELRGLALQSLWPHLLTTESLLICIIPPQRPSNVGTYSHFLTEQIAGTVPVAELPAALTHAAAWPSGKTYGPHPDPLLDLTVQLIERGLVFWDRPGVLTAVAGLLVACAPTLRLQRATQRHSIQQLLADASRRRALIEELLNRTSLTPKLCTSFLMAPLCLAVEVDGLWLLEQIETAPSDRRPLWAWWVGRAVGIPADPRVADRLLILLASEPALSEAYDWVSAWELDSPRARKVKADHLRRLRMEREPARAPLDPFPEQRVAHDLELVEQGEANRWERLAFDLTLEPTSTAFSPDPTTPIKARHGWKAGTPLIRQRIVAAAQTYLTQCASGNAWLGSDSIPWPVIAGLLALELLEAEGLSDDLSRRALENWVPALISATPVGETVREGLLRLAYREVPEKVLHNVELLLDQEVAVGGVVTCVYRLGPILDARIEAKLLRRLETGGLKPESAFRLGHFLLSRGTEGALAQCVAQVPAATDSGTHDRSLLALQLALLLIHAPKKHWDTIWSYFGSYPDLAQQALEWVIRPRTPERGTFLEAMDEIQLAALYAWMSRRFPPASDPQIAEAHEVTQREMFAELRSSVLQHLVQRGSAAACERLASLVDALPEQRPWLPWQLREARMKARSQAWAPPTVPEIIALFQDRQRRHVKSEEQLLSVIVDSLNRLQDRFKERPSALESLWNYDGGGMRRKNFRPKDEESLSDYVADWLRDDLGASRGIVVNREVQPRRGQKTDIYVNAVVRRSGQQPADCLTVVIEVKGCWNPGLWTAMQTQLVDDYMTRNAIAHGVYLIGWYLCSIWSDKDGRKRNTPRDPLGGMLARLLSQSKEIAKGRPELSVVPHILRLGLESGERLEGSC